MAECQHLQDIHNVDGFCLKQKEGTNNYNWIPQMGPIMSKSSLKHNKYLF